MYDRGFDTPPGEERQRYLPIRSGGRHGLSWLPQVLGCRAWPSRRSALVSWVAGRVWFSLQTAGCAAALAMSLSAAEVVVPTQATNSVHPAATADAAATNAVTHFDVRAYVVKYDPLVFTNAPADALTQYTGTNVSLDRIRQAAADLLLEYQQRGYQQANISIARELITNGIVTLNVYQGVFPQVFVSGKSYPVPGGVGAAPVIPVPTPTGTNATVAAKTNATPRFNVIAYEIRGDTLLSFDTLMAIFAKRTGTNVTVSDITQAASDLQMDYRNRGYPTVKVVIPEQKLTNGIVKIRVFEGRLSEIIVAQNHYFSSNNVMRALPSLRTNIILNGPLFQAELDRANRNQDRQIYPQIEEGLQENTSVLHLQVKDRLPLHAKVDFNNLSSPGTPDLRVNTSASYQNLWQLEHAVGLQYSFSPESYKAGESWNFYDQPLVANYGGFYRLPLAGAESVEQSVAAKPQSFGYDEATHRFRLPAPTGRPELNFYASRSAIDTDVTTLSSGTLFNTNGNSLTRQDLQQDITINSALGAHLNLPLQASASFQSGLSPGIDYKGYELTSYKTNIFTLTSQILDTISNPGHVTTNINVSTVNSPVPTTSRSVNYLPLWLRYDAGLRDALGMTSFGLGLSANTWYSGSSRNLELITGSTQSSGYWVILTPSMSRDFMFHTNWVLSLHAEGQWADQPLISSEQYGLGGVNSIRGYQEGEVFGDTGWWIGFEQKTPPQVIGLVYRNHPLIVRASVYMEYGEAYLLDSQGRQGRTQLWGAGFGGVASIGANWEARFLVSWPLLGVANIEAGQPYFNFSLSAQF
jgi:hemolysin activation/secretion protein